MSYTPDPGRYNSMEYRRCGRSGIKLPAVSLGLWHNFGHIDPLEKIRAILRTAFDSGVTHFDLAITMVSLRVQQKKILEQSLKKIFSTIVMN